MTDEHHHQVARNIAAQLREIGVRSANLGLPMLAYLASVAEEEARREAAEPMPPSPHLSRCPRA